jgi:hypothetical protein
MMVKRDRDLGLRSRELALVSLFSALWISAQLILGPVLGRFSLGPISFHGVVNRVVGWMLMLILANVSGKFGRVSIMTLIASLGTRIIRLSPLTGIVTGIGYVLGGLIFDIMFFGLHAKKTRDSSGTRFLLAASTISGVLAIVPYLLFKFLILGLEAFIILTPLYVISLFKGTIFSVVGTILGISMMTRVKSIL